MSTPVAAAGASVPAAVHAPACTALLLGVLGAVHVDIGTSPTYALREAPRVAGGASTAAVLGTVPLVI